MDTQIYPKLTVRFYTDKKCFGPGVAALLTLVRELGSLRAAAIRMNMAYSKAWAVMKNSEEALGCKLLTSVSGGRNGGGAVLTPQAERLLTIYEELSAELDELARSLLQRKLRQVGPEGLSEERRTGDDAETT